MFKRSILNSAVKEVKMANNIEQCLIALTQIITDNQAAGGSFRSQIEHEIRFVPIFDGARGTLPSFKDAVDRVLADHPTKTEDVFKIIYNIKIQGAAKNVLQASPPKDWEQCKTKLQSHFRASKDQFQITREINQLKVRSIMELDYKLTNLVEDFTELASFDENNKDVILIFTSMLIQKVKELTVGTLAYAVNTKFNLTEIREIVRQFIGQDQFNLKTYNYDHGYQQQFKPNVSNNFRPNLNKTQYIPNNQMNNGIRPNYNQNYNNQMNNGIRQNYNQHHNNNGSGNYSMRSNRNGNNNSNFNNVNTRSSNYRNPENYSGNRNTNAGPSRQSGQFNNQFGNQNINRYKSNSQQTRQSFMDVDNMSNDNEFFTN